MVHIGLATYRSGISPKTSGRVVSSCPRKKVPLCHTVRLPVMVDGEMFEWLLIIRVIKAVYLRQFREVRCEMVQHFGGTD